MWATFQTVNKCGLNLIREDQIHVFVLGYPELEKKNHCLRDLQHNQISVWAEQI